jgi:hypothetical protein
MSISKQIQYSVCSQTHNIVNSKTANRSRDSIAEEVRLKVLANLTETVSNNIWSSIGLNVKLNARRNRV